MKIIIMIILNFGLQIITIIAVRKINTKLNTAQMNISKSKFKNT